MKHRIATLMGLSDLNIGYTIFSQAPIRNECVTAIGKISHAEIGCLDAPEYIPSGSIRSGGGPNSYYSGGLMSFIIRSEMQ